MGFLLFLNSFFVFILSLSSVLQFSSTILQGTFNIMWYQWVISLNHCMCTVSTKIDSRRFKFVVINYFQNWFKYWENIISSFRHQKDEYLCKVLTFWILTRVFDLIRCLFKLTLQSEKYFSCNNRFIKCTIKQQFFCTTYLGVLV